MQSQETPPAVVEQEKSQVKEIANLSDNDKVTLNDSGWDSRVYVINDGQYIIKFPRSEKIRARYSSQIKALELASGIISGVTVPKVLWQDPYYRYFGYAGIAGLPLAKVLPELDSATKEHIGEVLGYFLSQFHQLRLEDARLMSIDQEIIQVQDWYQKGLNLTGKFFTTEEQNRLDTLVYDIWPSQLNSLGGSKKLCHGDFHFDNIFYSQNTGVGVIDFGDVCKADPSKDFADFSDNLIFEAAIKSYGSDDNKLRDKIRLREEMTRIITMTAQLMKHDNQAAKETIANIKESFRLF